MLSQAVPEPIQVLPALLSQGGRSSLAAGPAPRGILPGELLGVDAGDVWSGSEQPGVDGAAGRGDGGGENVPGWATPEPGDRRCPAGAGCIVAGSSRLALDYWCISKERSCT